MSKNSVIKNLNGSKLKIGIVYSRFNGEYVLSLKKWALQAFTEAKVNLKNIEILEVPGAYELPYGAGLLIKNKADVVLCLGSLIKGETMHFEYIAEAITQGIMNLNLQYGVPVIFGVLTCLTEEQALNRTKDSKENLGYQWGKTAVEMGLLKIANQVEKHECECGEC